MTVNSKCIYEALGIRPIINAAGTFTEYGGSLMPQSVRDAWREAANWFVDIRELQDCVGAKIADVLSVEAALVTGGAASSILLGTAAAITLRDDRFVTENVVAPDGYPFEVIRQRSHRDVYDRQLTMCGVKIVEVDSEAEFADAVNPRTVLTMAYNVYDSTSSLQHDHWLELSHQHRVPAMLDAAADTPPVENLSRFNHLGYDLVTYSGGKAIRGPQGTGLLLGRHHLIEAAKRNAIPNEGTVGRVAKVSKEDIVAFWKALELFLSGAPDSGATIVRRCQQQLDLIDRRITSVPGIDTEFITPKGANQFPHLLVTWDEVSLGVTCDQLVSQLRNGRPPIATGRVHGTGDAGLLISAINLQEGEAEIIGNRLLELLRC